MARKPPFCAVGICGNNSGGKEKNITGKKADIRDMVGVL